VAEQDRAPTTPAREVYSADAPATDAELSTRTVAREAAFLLPHLRPGMRLLDVGCGPGSITLGLAAAVAPGEVVGLDLRPEPIAQARAAAARAGVTNARFEVGSAYALPFPDAAFDAAFAHQVLIHLREPGRALAEVRRVLRPGGVVGVCDVDFGASLQFPLTPLREQGRALLYRVLEHNGGHPWLGRTHRRLLREAGFDRPAAGATALSAGTPEETRRAAALMKAVWPGPAATALAEGWADRETVDAMLAEIDAWAERPDAFWLAVSCHAVGWAGERARP
jgi:ubiquinone/menaquinone biosynthesis C-methylase UbiE